jgi:protein-S-isoprenylcysteine O-methyltransferase Ste14
LTRSNIAAGLPASTPNLVVSQSVPASASLGARVFEHRRWIHPPFLVLALLLGNAQPPALVAGTLLLLVHLALRLWSCRHIRGAARVHAAKAQRSGRTLVTTGPFARLRNPLYVANVLGLTGVCLMFGPAWLAPIAALAACAWYHRIVLWEEGVLLRLHPGYAAYVARVPRWLPRGTVPVHLAGRPPYPWRKVLRRERGAALLVASLIALATARMLAG